MCSSRKAFHAIKFCCTASESAESLVRKCCRATRKTGMSGRIANVSFGLKTNMVTIVKPVVRHIRKIDGRRSEPK
jgi:hypothetical protein